jgi:hypothetical protein
LRVQELAARIKEAGWPGDPVRFAAALVDEITDPAHGVVTGEQLAHEAALLRDEIRLVREELLGEIRLLREELQGENKVLREELHGENKVLREELHGENKVLREEVQGGSKLLREEMRAIEARLELRIERGLRQWGLLIVGVMGVIGTLLALLD